MFIYSYNEDVRISSNSWGTTNLHTYDTTCKEIDRFVWENDDMVFVFAAGNSGEKGYVKDE